ncbi:hypothetical protein [Amycolatopsis magusensis]|uniref:ANTAR domain-containing protein n=1 Tax=Amycolatopsis magusensis TaxID=882444 RepID=A0ABS4Q376_9PSEU|nr:hypothetical protein [Amycolatopsis magusensis]MBP2185570.1 hypothetical protein [Amycolatopsis magusensis]
MTFEQDEHAVETLARRVQRGVGQRAGFHEAVGVLRGWQGCDSARARQDLADGHDGQDAEVTRVSAQVNARARPGTDPDLDFAER